MRVAFAGSPAAAVPPLRALVAGRPRGDGRGHPARPGARALRRAVADAGRGGGRGAWASRCCGRGRSTTRRSSSRSRPAGAEALAVVAFGQILREGVLSRWPSINVHFSLLPAYRGAAPVERAIMDGATETGVTIMQMDAGPRHRADARARRAIEIGEDEDAGSLTARLSELGGPLLAEVLTTSRPGGCEPVTAARGGGLAGAQDHARGPRPRPLPARRRAGPAGPGAVPAHRGDARDRRRALQGVAGARHAPSPPPRRSSPARAGAWSPRPATGRSRSSSCSRRARGGWRRPPSCAGGAGPLEASAARG